MSPETESSEASLLLDQLAYRVAEICCKIRSIRDEIAALPSVVPPSSLEIEIQQRFSRISELEAERESLFPTLKTEVKNIVSSLKMNGLEYDQFLLEAEAKLRLEFHKFKQIIESPSSAKQGSKFRGWLRILVTHARVDYYRESVKGSAGKLNQKHNSELEAKYGKGAGNNLAASSNLIMDESKDLRRSRQSDVTQRILPSSFTSKEEEYIESLPELCQLLFLFSTGLWHQLTLAKKERWQAAKTTPFEQNRLTAIARANRFVLRAVEDELAVSSINPESDHEKLFQDHMKKKSNNVAQNLNRHFWKFMQINTVWLYLFAFIDQFDAELVEQIEETLDADLILAYLQCDVYFRCDTSSRCFDWLGRCGCENTILKNLGRVAGQKSFINMTQSGSKRRTNEKKWEYACQLAGRDTDEIGADEYIADIFKDRDGPRGRLLPLSVASKRHYVNLPLAFESMSKAERQEDRYDFNDD